MPKLAEVGGEENVRKMLEGCANIQTVKSWRDPNGMMHGPTMIGQTEEGAWRAIRIRDGFEYRARDYINAAVAAAGERRTFRAEAEAAQAAERPVEIVWGAPEITAVEKPRERPRVETMSVDMHFAGRPLHIEINVRGMNEGERAYLEATIRSMGSRPSEYLFGSFMERFHDRISNIKMEFTDEHLNRYEGAVPIGANANETIATIRRLAGRA